ADEHRRVPVHAADRAALRKPALAARVDHLAALRALRPGHPLEDGPADPVAYAADATFQVTSTMTAHPPIIPAPHGSSRPRSCLRAHRGCPWMQAWCSSIGTKATSMPPV